MTGGMRTVLGAVFLLCFAFGGTALYGCGDQAKLDGTSWTVRSWSASSLDPADFTITASFADGRIGGTSAVNHYGGSYTATAAGGFSVGDLASTEMAGPEPAMRAETIYLRLLRRVREYRLANDQLTLLDGGGQELLVFVPRVER